MKKSVILFCFLFLFLTSCRYKENDTISFLSAKKRLERTWVLKELLIDGNKNVLDEKLSCYNEEMDIKLFENDKIVFTSKLIGPVGNLINRKKNLISTYDFSASSKILKLTNKDLWLEGSLIFGVGLCYGVDNSSKCLLKFHAK